MVEVFGHGVIRAGDTYMFNRARRRDLDRQILPFRKGAQCPVVERTGTEELEHLSNDSLVDQGSSPPYVCLCTIAVILPVNLVKTRVVQGTNEFVVKGIYALNRAFMDNQIAIKNQDFIEVFVQEKAKQQPHVSCRTRVLTGFHERY